MPIFTIKGRQYDISRAGVILDTNVLVHKYIDRERKKHDEVNYVFAESTRQWIISYAVVQEVWGMINSKVNKSQAHKIAMEFLGWIKQPGENIRVIPIDDDTIAESEFYRKMGVDCVDGIIYQLALSINQQCGIVPTIATYDTSDFYKILALGPTFILCDMHSYAADLLGSDED